MSTSGNHRANLGANLGAGFARLAWSRRLETGLTLAATAARVALVLVCGTWLATCAVGLAAVFLVTYGPSRQWLIGFYRFERLERRCARAFDAAGIDIVAAPAVLGEHPIPSGAVYDLALSPRLTATDLDARTEPLAVAFGAAHVRVREDRTAAAHAQLVVAYRDPLTESPIPWPWIGIGQTDLWSGLPLGYDEDDGLVVLDLAGHHLLLGGEPGAGKSNALSLVVAAAALDPTVELWCFDGKLVELAAWRRCCRRFVGADLDEATVALGELRALMEARYARMLERGLRKVDRDTGPGLILVVIDELALYLQGKSKARDQLAEVLRDIVARGRAAGIVVAAATQKPASDVVPTSIRDLFGCRLALRCATRDASDTVLGAGWAAEGYTASDLDPAHRGVGYLLAEGGLPWRMRCFVLGDEHLDHVARRAEVGAGKSSMSKLQLGDEAGTLEGIFARLRAPGGYDAFDAQVRGARCCRRPVRLSGRITKPTVAGHREVVFDTRRLPDGVLLKACGTRRETVCPPCASLYRGDAFALVAAGMRGGKGIPEHIGDHPTVLLTLTAPSFGPVHRRRPDGTCRPADSRCAHGILLGCAARHEETDVVIGQALCPDCYDYEAAVLFNVGVSELWRRTTIYALRALRSLVGMSARESARRFQLSYVKVVEFQRRGSVHLHALVRIDVRGDELGEAPSGIDVDVLAAAMRIAARKVSAPLPGAEPGRRMTWGDQVDAVVVTGAEQGRRRAAAYLAKYASKGSDRHGVLDHRLRAGIPRDRRLPGHLRALAETAWALGDNPALADLRLRLWAHTCGFRGHFLTKSRRYSTTFGALRAERQHWRLAVLGVDKESVPGVDEAREWQFEGSGYVTAGDVCLARNLEDEVRLGRSAAREEVAAGSTTGSVFGSGRSGIDEKQAAVALAWSRRSSRR